MQLKNVVKKMVHFSEFFYSIMSLHISGMVFNFDKQNSSEIDSLDTKYDYLSMMHYGWNAFGRAQKMTIKTLDPRFQYLIGQWEGFSEIDIVQLNKLYRCSKLCRVAIKK